MCQKIQKARGDRSELDVMSWRDENYPERIKKVVDIALGQWYSNEAVAQDNMLRSQRENCLKNENKAWLNAKCMII